VGVVANAHCMFESKWQSLCFKKTGSLGLRQSIAHFQETKVHVPLTMVNRSIQTKVYQSEWSLEDQPEWVHATSIAAHQNGSCMA
jgi:hypothetical protein